MMRGRGLLRNGEYLERADLLLWKGSVFTLSGFLVRLDKLLERLSLLQHGELVARHAHT